MIEGGRQCGHSTPSISHKAVITVAVQWVPQSVDGQGKAPTAEDVLDQQDGHGFGRIVRGGETLDPLGEGTGDGEEVFVTPWGFWDRADPVHLEVGPGKGDSPPL